MPWIIAEISEPLHDRWIGENCSNFLVEPFHERSWQTGRCDKALIAGDCVAGVSRFGDGWNVAETEESTAAGHRNCAQLPAADVFDHRCRRIRNKVYALAEEVQDGGLAPAIWYMLKVNVCSPGK